MQTIFFILLLFLIVIFSVLLYYKNRHSKLDRLNKGECPSCGAKPRIFFDENSKKTFRQEVIKTSVLKNHGCSGVNDIEYRCKVCGLKEVYPQSSYDNCGL